GFGIFTPRIGRGHRKAHRLKGQLETPAVQEGIAADEEGVGSLARKSREDPIDPLLVLALKTWTCSPMARAAGSTSFNVISVPLALSGLTSTATRVAAGTNSCRSSSRFAANSWE